MVHAAIGLALVCAQRNLAYRTGVRQQYLVAWLDGVEARVWPDAIAGHMVDVYVLGLNLRHDRLQSDLQEIERQLPR